MGEVGHNRTAIQVERDYAKISDLYLKGMAQHRIAEKLGMGVATVNGDLKVIQQRWIENSLVGISERKAIEVAKLDHLEFEYWKGWNRSVRDAVTEIEEMVVKDGVVSSKNRVQKRGQAGDPRFLEGVERVVMDRCKILGITLDINLNIDLMILPLQYLERIVAGESEIDVFADFQKSQKGETVEAAFLPDPLAPQSLNVAIESVKVEDGSFKVEDDQLGNDDLEIDDGASVGTDEGDRGANGRLGNDGLGDSDGTDGTDDDD